MCSGLMTIAVFPGWWRSASWGGLHWVERPSPAVPCKPLTSKFYMCLWPTKQHSSYPLLAMGFEWKPWWSYWSVCSWRDQFSLLTQAFSTACRFKSIVRGPAFLQLSWSSFRLTEVARHWKLNGLMIHLSKWWDTFIFDCRHTWL